jgi:hypothetical protein
MRRVTRRSGDFGAIALYFFWSDDFEEAGSSAMHLVMNVLRAAPASF